MRDAFLDASWTFQRARLTAVRDRSAPVVTPSVLVGHMPDPRVSPVPFRKSVGGSAVIGFAGLLAFVALIWALALVVMP